MKRPTSSRWSRRAVSAVTLIAALVLLYVAMRPADTPPGNSRTRSSPTATDPSPIPAGEASRTGETSITTARVGVGEAPVPPSVGPSCEIPVADQLVAVEELPPEALDTLELIDDGGPFPYRQDGDVFDNRERELPRRSRGYYHEYTVETPGSDDRGARRIVAGDCGERWYTDDHYDSFALVGASS